MSFTRASIGFALLFALNSRVAQGQAQPNNELRETRQEMEQLKQEYEQMKQAYETRFKKLDDRLTQLESANPAPAGAPAAVASGSKPAPKITVVATTPEEMQFQEPTDSMQLALAEQEN